MAVSLALRGDPGVSEKTRKRIDKIARTLGYAPDPMLTALASYRKRQRPAAYKANIAWLSSNPDAKSTGKGDFYLYYEGARTRAAQLGYVLEEIDLQMDEHKDPRRLRRILDARNISGLILAPSSVAAATFDFDFSRHSAVRIGYSYRHPVLNTVANMQFRTVLKIMQKVADFGYQRPGIILSEEVDERTSWNFLGGFLAGHHFFLKRNWIAPFYTPTSMAAEFAPTIMDWIFKQRIDCLFGIGHRSTFEALSKLGLQFPDQVGYVDGHLSEGEEYFSGMNQNSRQIGTSAVDLLVGMMHRHDTGIPAIPTHHLVEASWLDGKTLPPKAGTNSRNSSHKRDAAAQELPAD